MIAGLLAGQLPCNDKMPTHGGDIRRRARCRGEGDSGLEKWPNEVEYEASILDTKLKQACSSPTKQFHHRDLDMLYKAYVNIG